MLISSQMTSSYFKLCYFRLYLLLAPLSGMIINNFSDLARFYIHTNVRISTTFSLVFWALGAQRFVPYNTSNLLRFSHSIYTILYSQYIMTFIE